MEGEKFDSPEMHTEEGSGFIIDEVGLETTRGIEYQWKKGIEIRNID